MQGSLETNHQLNHAKSVWLSSERAKLGGLFDSNALMERQRRLMFRTILMKILKVLHQVKVWKE